ncbi:hypothetical protein Taro_053185 [Colocasia esculenta]|uniref:Uncharacterized protein n=1 Tax=Colocasia esculenta TaxID=4460 RepID=A0A843XKJ1_COLES|nr:hypothetical protein [Colocasia esculenta]
MAADAPAKPRGRACLCAPTTHPGSFRCSLHRGCRRIPAQPSGAAACGGTGGQAEAKAAAAAAKAKSMKALLMQIIGPSRQDLCRRRNFQPRPTRFGSATGGDHSVAVV